MIRKHAQMLSDAGVDAIVFDTSNKLTYRRSYLALLEVYRQMRQEGNRTPQIAFLTPFGDPASTVHRLFKDLYSTGEYQDLWFRWDGKPIILADRAKVSGPEKTSSRFASRSPTTSGAPAAEHVELARSISAACFSECGWGEGRDVGRRGAE